MRVIACGLIGTSFLASGAYATAPLILNEFNAVHEDYDWDQAPPQGDGVDDGEFLSNNVTQPYKGYDYGGIMDATAAAGAGNAGRIKGNGGNWIELVVTQDHLDARNWSLEWQNEDAQPGQENHGSIAFTNNAFWSNLRAGTIITIIERGEFTATFPDGSHLPVAFHTDTSFSPQHNDWWINLELSETDTSLVYTPLTFKVDNDGWQMTIRNSQGQAVFGPVGEHAPDDPGNPQDGWGGGGINSQEAGVLSANPGPDVNPAAPAPNGPFSDNDYTTFGAPNHWSSNTMVQDFDANHLRDWWNNRVPGDANCDGMVTIADLGELASHWQATGVDWFAGDFNGDDTVTIADLGALASNWQYGVPGASMSFEQALQAAGLGGVAVPEPAAAVMLGALAITLAGRRRKGAA